MDRPETRIHDVRLFEPTSAEVVDLCRLLGNDPQTLSDVGANFVSCEGDSWFIGEGTHYFVVWPDGYTEGVEVSNLSKPKDKLPAEGWCFRWSYVDEVPKELLLAAFDGDSDKVSDLIAADYEAQAELEDKLGVTY